MTAGGLDSYSNYGGSTEHKDMLLLISRTRDSSILEESNFDAALKRLGGESETVQVHRFNHWACGWIEHILIDASDKEKVAIAEQIERDIDAYPVLNEDDFSEREWNQMSEYWKSLSIKERVNLCGEYGICIFSARRDTVPQDDSGRLEEYLKS